MPEEVKGLVGALMTRGWKGDLHCHLVFTDERLIVSVKGLLAQVAMGAGVQFGAAGAIVGASVASSEDSKKRVQLQQLSPEQILQANKRNINLPYANITKVQVGKKLGTTRLYVTTSDETYKFKFQGVKLEQVQNWVAPLLPASLTLQLSDKLEE